ncbi:hypothetical protein GCM10011490_13000 [Pseudoclavibacter endophyticus]|nr:hypothetical protein GCM10011490_13000 [Pseudoclavibacter endophyticus]
MLVVGMLFVVAAVLFGRAEFIALGAFLVALPACTYALRALFKPRLELERQIFPSTIAVGDRLRVIAEVRNRSIVALEPATYVDLTPGAAVSSIGGVMPQVGSRLRRSERHRRRRVAYTLTTMRRGVHDIGPLLLENIDGLGLTRRVIRVGDPESVEVWPHVHDIDSLDVPATRHGGEVEAGIAAAGDSDDVLTREYRRGDAMRRVHWRATARADDLRVRQEEHHAEVSSLIILDTTRSPIDDDADAEPVTIFDMMDAPEQARGARIDPVFEHCVSVAASVAVRLHELGYETELFETNEFLDGADDPRLGGLRVASKDSMSSLMRHLMHTQPNALGDTPERPSTVGHIAQRALRIGRAPIVYVHRELAGDDLAAIRDLGRVGTPAIAVIVGDHAGPATPSGKRVAGVQRDFAREGWEVVVMSTAHADPWASASRVGAPRGGARPAAKGAHA